MFGCRNFRLQKKRNKNVTIEKLNRLLPKIKRLILSPVYLDKKKAFSMCCPKNPVIAGRPRFCTLQNLAENSTV